MFTLKVENQKGEIFELTNNQSNYQIVSIEGTNPPSAIVNLSKIAMIDGSKFNSSKLNERNIVISIRLNGDVESNRIALYSFFRSKEWCRIHYANSSRRVYIDGYVESIDFSPFNKSEIVQISIICPNPYFKGDRVFVETFSKLSGGFVFPFDIDEVGISFSEINNVDALIINNPSERETGLTIQIDITDECNKILMRKLSNGETMQLNYEFLQYDRVIIHTEKGNKSISLIRNATEHNLFTAMRIGSKFFQLDLGDNIFDYSIDDGAHNSRAEIVFKYTFNYGGV